MIGRETKEHRAFPPGAQYPVTGARTAGSGQSALEQEEEPWKGGWSRDLRAKLTRRSKCVCVCVRARSRVCMCMSVYTLTGWRAGVGVGALTPTVPAKTSETAVRAVCH